MSSEKILLLGNAALPTALTGLWTHLPYPINSLPIDCTDFTLRSQRPVKAVIYICEPSETLLQCIARVTSVLGAVTQLWIVQEVSPQQSVLAFRFGISDILIRPDAATTESWLHNKLITAATLRLDGQQQLQTYQQEIRELLLKTADETHSSSDFLAETGSQYHIKLRCFGTFALAIGGHAVAVSLKASEKNLLAYLLLHASRPINKERLTARFWPDHTVASAKNLLHVLLSRVRKWCTEQLSASDLIVYESDCYHINARYQVEVDYQHFRVSYRKALQIPVDQPEWALPHLQQAYQLYRNRVLEDMYTQSWVQIMQHEADETYLQLLHCFSKVLQRLAWYDLAVQVDKMVVRLDPQSEAAYSRLLTAYAELGWRGKLVKCFAQYKQAIQEINLRPAPEMAALVALMTRQIGQS